GILVPQRCVSELQGTFTVFIVNSENKIEQREIKLGSTIGSFWLVNEGLQDGDKVVYEGLQKVKTGMTVNPTEANTKDLNTTEVEN
ncbi:MAG: efflux transporter periplasmic adaptor subunit, partial [Chlorobi bacterium]|nr:efflux transporter periplasmic adaptor subunit [Chlorobiota bacterium]